SVDGVCGMASRGLDSGHLADGVENHEVVNQPVVASRGDRDAGLLEIASVRLALVAERVVLGSDDERRGQTLELLPGGTERRDVRIVPGLLVRGVEVPAVLHERAWEEAARGELVVRGRADPRVAPRHQSPLVLALPPPPVP